MKTQIPPMTKAQYTATCTRLHALITSNVRSNANCNIAIVLVHSANAAIARMMAYYNSNTESSVAPAILSRANEMQSELDAALNRTTPATATESGQSMIILLIAFIAVLVCLFFATSAIARAAGYTDIVAMLDAMTHIFPTP